MFFPLLLGERRGSGLPPSITLERFVDSITWRQIISDARPPIRAAQRVRRGEAQAGIAQALTPRDSPDLSRVRGQRHWQPNSCPYLTPQGLKPGSSSSCPHHHTTNLKRELRRRRRRAPRFRVGPPQLFNLEFKQPVGLGPRVQKFPLGCTPAPAQPYLSRCT